MSSISFLSEGQLDLTYIWEHQSVQLEVVGKIKELIPMVWAHITSGGAGGQSSNVGEWTKKSDCWNKLKLRLAGIERFEEKLIQPETNEDGSYLNETQQKKIQEAEAIEPNYWFALANWAKSNNQLTPMDRKAAFNFGTMKSRNKGIASLKQALNALKIVEKAKELGFEGK